LLAEADLLLRQMLKAELQVARHHPRDAVVVEANELTQERNWQQSLSALAAFLLDNDLRKNGMGKVVAVLRIVNDEVAIAAHHLRQIFKRDVRARFGVIKAPVGIFLYNDRFALGSLGLWFWVAQHRVSVLFSTSSITCCCTAAAYHTKAPARQTFLSLFWAGRSQCQWAV